MTDIPLLAFESASEIVLSHGLLGTFSGGSLFGPPGRLLGGRLGGGCLFLSVDHSGSTPARRR
jgi:hypothetical protein